MKIDDKANLFWSGLFVFAFWGSVGLFFYTVHNLGNVNKPPFNALECYVDREHEPWEVFPDGQILQVGRERYLAVNREQRNTNDRYSGYKVYGFEIEIPVANKVWKKTECPMAWR